MNEERRHILIKIKIKFMAGCTTAETTLNQNILNKKKS